MKSKNSRVFNIGRPKLGFVYVSLSTKARWVPYPGVHCGAVAAGHHVPAGREENKESVDYYDTFNSILLLTCIDIFVD